jgi:hypothetical protein
MAWPDVCIRDAVLLVSLLNGCLSVETIYVYVEETCDFL